MVDFKFFSIQVKPRKCKACPLHNWVTAPVCNSGSVRHRIVLLGDAPGHDEDEAGQVFNGRVGGLLRGAMKTAGVAQQCYLANVIHCFPVKDSRYPQRGGRLPSPSEIATCWPLHTEAELTTLRPVVIVALGAIAARVLLKTERDITELRRDPGLRYEPTKSRVLVEYHPADILRQGSPNNLVQRLILTLKRAAKIVEKTPSAPRG